MNILMYIVGYFVIGILIATVLLVASKKCSYLPTYLKWCESDGHIAYTLFFWWIPMIVITAYVITNIIVKLTTGPVRLVNYLANRFINNA